MGQLKATASKFLSCLIVLFMIFSLQTLSTKAEDEVNVEDTPVEETVGDISETEETTEKTETETEKTTQEVTEEKVEEEKKEIPQEVKIASLDKTVGKVKFHVSFKDNTFTDNVSLNIKKVTDKLTLRKVEAYVEKKKDVESTVVSSYDISFINDKGKEVEPTQKVDVYLTLDKSLDSKKSYTLVHTLDNGKNEIVNADFSKKTVSFTSSSFSEYSITESDTNPSSSFQTELIDGNDIKLETDMTYSDSYFFVASKKKDHDPVEVDLNTHTLTIAEGDHPICINNGVNVIIKNGTITGSTNKIVELQNGSVTFDNVTFENDDIILITGGSDTKTATFKDCTIQNSKGSQNLININDNTTLNIDNTVFIDNKVNNIIEATNAKVSISNKSKIEGTTGNHAIYSNNSELEIKDSTISKNDVETAGVIFANGKSLSIDNTEITGNSSKQTGGAIRVQENCDATITNSKINKNSSSQSGGAISSDNAKVTIKDSELNSNSTTEGGGAIATYGNSELTLNKNTIDSNTASQGGGAIVAFANSKINLTDNTITNNNAKENGGAIRGDGDVKITIHSGTISSNTATENGGGISIVGNTELTIEDGTIEKNEATQNGGGIHGVGNSLIEIKGGKIDNNTAAQNGGGIFVDNKSLNISKGDITNNTANIDGWINGGGGIYAGGSTKVEIIGSNNSDINISNNTTLSSGGGIMINGENTVLILDKATIENNVAQTHEGGGISIGFGSATFRAGLIKNNRTGFTDLDTKNSDYSDWGGGGIFVSDKGTADFPEGTLVKNNTAYGTGGGVTGCATARVYIFGSTDKGAAIYSNKATGENFSGSGSAKSDDRTYGENNPVFMKEGFDDFSCYWSSILSKEMLGGGKENYKGSLDSEAYSDASNPDDYVISSYIAGLTASPSNTAAAESKATLIIEDNESYTHGGGILVNGTAIFGQAPDKISLSTALTITTLKQLNDLDGKVGALNETFTYEILDEDGKVVATGTNEMSDKKGTQEVTFDNRLPFNEKNCTDDRKEGDYWIFTYTIKEKNEKKAHIVYDDNAYTMAVKVKTVEEDQTTGSQTYKKVLYKIEDVKITDKEGKEISITDDGSNGNKLEFQDEAHPYVLTLKNQDEPFFENTYSSTEVKVKKAWDDKDNQDGIRTDEVTVHLLANGKEVDKVTLNQDNKWAHTFTKLRQYDDKDKEITYTVKEDSVEGYEAKITGNAKDGYTITNKHVPGTVEVSGKKTWKDNKNQDGKRPESITVKLYADGEEVDSIEVTKDDDWKYAFHNLDKKKDGKDIVYTIDEVVVEGYETEIDGYNITNSYTPEKTEVSGTKTWKDNDNEEGQRPESITVKLYANGKEVNSIEVTEADDWSYTFTNLDKYSKGKEVTYTIKEEKVEGYTTTISGYDITNTLDEPDVDIITPDEDGDNNNTDKDKEKEDTEEVEEEETEEKTVDTSDRNTLGSYFLMLVLALAGIISLKKSLKMKEE